MQIKPISTTRKCGLTITATKEINELGCKMRLDDYSDQRNKNELGCKMRLDDYSDQRNSCGSI